MVRVALCRRQRAAGSSLRRCRSGLLHWCRWLRSIVSTGLVLRATRLLTSGNVPFVGVDGVSSIASECLLVDNRHAIVGWDGTGDCEGRKGHGSEGRCLEVHRECVEMSMLYAMCYLRGRTSFQTL